jgi:HTH-type transcriptional regulator/antitoxin HigA
MRQSVKTVMRDSYLDLVRQHPLKAIKSLAQQDAAMRMMKALMIKGADLDGGARDYLETLAQLVKDYEQAQEKIDLADLSVVELLKHLMTEAEMNVSDLGRLLGSQSTASQILRGRRELSKTHIRRLADHFKVDAELFLR